MDIVESSRLLDNSKVCMERREGAIDGQRTPKRKRYLRENEEKKRFSYDDPLITADATNTSHSDESTMRGMNSITVICYYKYILMNITRVIYRNRNKRF
jgi:phage-related protein